MLGWSLNLDFAGSGSTSVARPPHFMLMGIGLLPLIVSFLWI